MTRPKHCRRICGMPTRTYFKPAGVPMSALEEIVLELDEMEALRLADLEGLYQEEAAERMKVSRPTFGRIIETARRKVAEALTTGKALRIEGGEVTVETLKTIRLFRCSDCNHSWELPYGSGRPAECPACKSRNIHRAEEDRGPRLGSCGGPGMGRGGRGFGRGCRKS
jgi:predicted DNA-binding protein (UPF0251 family)